MFKINGIKQIKKINKLEEDKKTIVLLLAIIEANIIKGTMTNINATILEQILTINNFLLVNDWITKLAVNNNGIDAFNLGTGNGYSVLELVEAFKKFNNIDVPYKIVGRRDGDIASCYADASKAKDILDWSCTYNIEDMVKDSYNYVKNSK